MKQLPLFPLEAGTVTAHRCSSRDTEAPHPNITVSKASVVPHVGKARQLDQFYTRAEVAEELYGWFVAQCGSYDPRVLAAPTFIEPSAGTGSFLRLLPPGSLAIDIDPKAPGIVEADFLSMSLPTCSHLVCIGNPPFGKRASLAIKFFNHAASAASVIAFIVPRTFEKPSIQDRLCREFHLLAERAVQSDAFVFEGRSKHVPTVFQVWVRRPWLRQKIKRTTRHPDFDFLTDRHRADFAVQRVGADAGRVHRNFELSLSSHYFIGANAKGVEATMRELDLATLAQRTAGNPSLSKHELIESYTRAISTKRLPGHNPAPTYARHSNHG